MATATSMSCTPNAGSSRRSNRLHLAANTGPVWVAIVDAFSGALVVFSITGLLLWSRLTGPRLLAIGLAGSTLLATVYYAGVL